MMIETKPHFEHERYEELCAMATAGALSPEESEILFAHLNECQECNAVFAEYQTIATEGMSLLADQVGQRARAATVADFDESSALSRLLESTEEDTREMTGGEEPRTTPVPIHLVGNRPVRFDWLRGALAASLLVAVGGGCYWWGHHTRPRPQTALATQAGPSSRAALEKLRLEKALREDNERSAALEDQATHSRAEADRLRAEAKDAADKLAALTAASAAFENQTDAHIAALTQERDATLTRLHDSEQLYQTVQEELTNLRESHRQDLLRVASLEERVGSLNLAINDQTKHVNVDEQYLSSDRDIRDLMGARSLHIIDVHDANGAGKNQRSFGRIFYTEGKQLIFYAFDLDNKRVMNASYSFEAWGERLGQPSSVKSLGILYVDDKQQRRWSLKVDDPRQLSEINSVFVTLEPHGGEKEKPEGKRILFAFLGGEANHP
jgi:hypothetical protein